MRGLKITAIVSFTLLLVMVCLVGYLFLSSEVQVTNISAQGISAGNNPEAFEKLKSAVSDGTFQGTLFQKPLEWKPASDYVYIEYTLTLRNNCLIPIDMIEVQIVPQSTDILQTADLDVHSLDLKSEGSIKTSILSPKDAHPVREIIVTYYVWGVSFSLRTTYGN